MELNLNGPDTLAKGDKGYNGDTEGAYVVLNATSLGIDVRHETTGEVIAMPRLSHRESYGQDWRWFRDPAPGQEESPKATATTVAQAISYAVDEFQEFGGHNDARRGLYLSHVDDDSSHLRVTEVSAELENAPNGLQSQFTVKTSDGREWTVRVTPKA